MPAIQTRNKTTGLRKDIRFIYDENTDTLTCPAGKTLTRRSYHSHRNNIEYARIAGHVHLKVNAQQITTDGLSNGIYVRSS